MGGSSKRQSIEQPSATHRSSSGPSDASPTIATELFLDYVAAYADFESTSFGFGPGRFA